MAHAVVGVEALALWQQALAQGAPADVVARIFYDSTGYTFEANGRDFKRRFGRDCKPLP